MSRQICRGSGGGLSANAALEALTVATTRNMRVMDFMTVPVCLETTGNVDQGRSPVMGILTNGPPGMMSRLTTRARGQTWPGLSPFSLSQRVGVADECHLR